MTTLTTRPAAPTPRSTAAACRRGLARILLPVVLLPVGLGTLVRAATGRTGRPWRFVASGLVSVVFGVLGLVELGLFGLFLARGLAYGLVVDGPYTDAWGGPSLAGAWAAHAAIGFGVAVAGALLGVAVTALHGRVTDGLLGGRRLPGWVVAVSAGLTLGVALFLVAFVRQL